MDTLPRHNKRRIQSESRTRARLPSSFKKAKNVAQSEGSEDGSLVARGKATRWTPEEDEALFEGVSLYLKSKGLQVHPPSHLPAEMDVQVLQASSLSRADRDAQTAADCLGHRPQPFPRSLSVSSFSSLRSSSNSPFALSPPAGLHPRLASAAFVASAASTGSRESRDSDRSLLNYSSNEFASSSSSPSSLSSSSSVCTGSTLTSDINHTLARVHLGNSSFEDDLEKERGLKDEGFQDEDDDDAMDLFNRFVDSSSSPQPTQINQQPFPLPTMRLPSSFSTRQEPIAVSQPSAQLQTHLGQSTAAQGSVAMNWAWEGSSNQISPFQAHLTALLAGSSGSTSGMTAPLTLPYGDEFSVSNLRLNNRSSYQLPRESLRPLTPGEILAAESSSSSPSSSDSSSSSPRSFFHIGRGSRAWQEQMLTSMAMDGPPTNILERGRDRDNTQPTQKSQNSNDNNVEPDNENVLTQESYALAVSRALSHCPWSSVVQATPRLAGIRTGVQAQARWSEALDPQVLKGPWTEAEDQLLMQRVEQFAKCWIWIADGIPGRTQRQCRTRWVQIQTRLDREKAASITVPAARAVKAEKRLRGSGN
ncbi:hypothetical protein EMPS_04924 [Entomortierella parvispora]|uniref:Myb-like domain-containing protein n=1 Tax=Entomortierella parvispora TaxID=205924 RepID=A0A9P3LVU6_9FUNG|nr:hypothetical protein EMPS_04924 [Entomortierella parvispora]